MSVATGELTTEEARWDVGRGDSVRPVMSGGARGYHDGNRFGIGTAF